MAGPLTGIRVLDLSQVVAGPVCTMLLAEQGAEVIKVEFLEGEILRKSFSYSRNNTGALVLNCNRGKLGVALDLNQPEGIEIVKKLAADVDVFVQNYRAGAIERLGITAEELRAENDKLITVWMSGYGQTGPMADRPVFDPVMQAATGHVSLQVNPRVPFPDVHRTIICDKSTALTTAQAITAALFARERPGPNHGKGQHIEVSMLDTGIYFLWPDGAMADTLIGDEPVLQGPTLYEAMSVTQCSDGHIVYYLAGPRHFDGFVRAIGHADWLEDERFNNPVSRAQPENAGLLSDAIYNAFASMTVEDAIAALDSGDVPAAPMLSVGEVPDHPQVKHNEVFTEWEHPVAGKLRQPRAAAQFSATPNEPGWFVPELGEDTETVLRDAGITDESLLALRSAGVIN